MKHTNQIIALLAAGLAAGCASMPFTHGMRDEYHLTPEQLQRIQYYTSGPITLERRVLRATGEATPQNELQLTQAEAVRVVHIPAGTPGVAVSVSNDMMEISFEPGKSLHFGSSPAKRKSVGDYYSLLARDWSGRRGTLTYGGQTYVTGKGSGSVHLLVDIVPMKKYKVAERKVKGVTIGKSALEEPPGRVVEKEPLLDDAKSGLTIENPPGDEGPRVPLTP